MAAQFISAVLSVLWWTVLFPAFLVIATPVILMLALFRKAAYSHSVRRLYLSAIDVWTEYGAWLIS